MLEARLPGNYTVYRHESRCLECSHSDACSYQATDLDTATRVFEELHALRLPGDHTRAFNAAMYACARHGGRWQAARS